MRNKWEAERFELNEKCRSFELKYFNLASFETERVNFLNKTYKLY